ncbi:MAG: cation transporter [Chitinophagaceae bacterium]|nr:cation transporter [Chitinophagaceae bacterium]
MNRSTFKITKMDCPSEEQLIRMKLEPLTEVRRIDFDIPDRRIVVYHDGDSSIIDSALAALQLGSTLEHTETTHDLTGENTDAGDKKLLRMVLAINAAFFVAEMTAGLLANSMGLVADSLDMLADAIVYGMSLAAIGGAMTRKKLIARLSGYFQLVLALAGLAEVVHRFATNEGIPQHTTMIVVSLFALTGNAASLYLLHKRRSKEAHMEASYIFTSNDVIANIGVVLAGVVVYVTQNALPDLVIGTLVFFLVVRGAVRILQLAK